MGIFAGFDVSQYPGDENMAHIRANSNLRFVAFYLGPAPCHPDTGWMSKRAELESQGWGTVPVFLGRQLNESLAGGGEVLDPNQAAAQGNTDGNLAADLMAKAGYGTGRWVYLDVENGPPAETPQVSYIQAWAAAVRARQFCPGIYCSHLMADGLSARVPGARIWAVKVASVEKHDASHYAGNFPTVDPHASGYQYAYVWQHEEEAEVNIAGLFLTVDLDVAITADPSR